MATIEPIDGLRVVIRSLADEDRHYILQRWRRHAHPGARLEDLLDRLGARIACAESDPTFILAWAVVDPAANLAHYVYTRPAFRRARVASALLATLREPINCSHWSEDAETLQERIRLHYRPSLAKPKKGQPHALENRSPARIGRGQGDHVPARCVG